MPIQLCRKHLLLLEIQQHASTYAELKRTAAWVNFGCIWSKKHPIFTISLYIKTNCPRRKKQTKCLFVCFHQGKSNISFFNWGPACCFLILLYLKVKAALIHNQHQHNTHPAGKKTNICLKKSNLCFSAWINFFQTPCSINVNLT